MSDPVVSVLHQAAVPPPIGGIRKPFKPGGYTDSGADIAFALQHAGIRIVTPAATPDARCDRDWSFPDTPGGIAAALGGGARVLWANTVLYTSHPLGHLSEPEVLVVGNVPADVEAADDKFETNVTLGEAGCPVARSVAVTRGATSSDAASAGQASAAVLARESLTTAWLAERGFELPLVVKPIRGRGSAGVSRATSWPEVFGAIDAVLGARSEVDGSHVPIYGDAVMLEEYLPGREVTVAVLPPGMYQHGERTVTHRDYWTLPAVERTGHRAGIAPYSGNVPVTKNSRVHEWAPAKALSRDALESACAAAARLVRAESVIRIDCRQDANGSWKLFDLNMKPNLTGAGRPGRDDQDSLVTMAGRAIGWSYPGLLVNLLAQAWASRSAR